MENIFVLVVLGAVGVVGLLGFFLMASEKELKVKRREIEELLTKLENVPGGSAPLHAATPQVDNSAELTQLRAQNEELQNQVNSLSGKLELSRRSIQELESTHQKSAASEAESLQLRAANDQLKGELNNLRIRIQSSEAQSMGAAAQNQDVVERQAKLQSENMELNQKLQDAQARLRELDGLQQKAQRVEALEAEQREERQRLQGRIAELESEFSSSREKLREMVTLQQRLAEAEQTQSAMRAESERHEQEIARWRERISEADEIRQRLAVLKAPYEQLLSKQTALAEQQREFQDHLGAFTHLLATPVQDLRSAAVSPSDSASRTQLPGGEPARVVALPSSQDTGASHSTPAASQDKPKRRFGIFSAIVLLGVSGLLAATIFTSNSDHSTEPVLNASAVKSSRPATPPLSGAQTASQPVKAVEPQDVAEPPAAPNAAKENSDISKSNPSIKQEKVASGTYQITRTSRVYAGPNELSQLIGEIAPGTRVNVVNGRDGWLEIHSKHGRPPGFIRREVAARVTEQN